jgi:hypothetical protein
VSLQYDFSRSFLLDSQCPRCCAMLVKNRNINAAERLCPKRSLSGRFEYIVMDGYKVNEKTVQMLLPLTCLRGSD